MKSELPGLRSPAMRLYDRMLVGAAEHWIPMSWFELFCDLLQQHGYKPPDPVAYLETWKRQHAAGEEIFSPADVQQELETTLDRYLQADFDALPKEKGKML